MAVVDDLIAATPPPEGHRGQHFYWPALSPGHPLLGILLDGAAFDVAEQLIRPGRLAVPRQAQVALNIPPYPHRPGRGHIDGVTPPEEDGRPGTFTMLAGLMLTDQTVENAGNLWVWPGTHRAQEAFFRERGPEALMASRGLPDITHPAPEQVLGRAGDLLLAHYMLSHNIGGDNSPSVRRGIYYRPEHARHRRRWRHRVLDLWLRHAAGRGARRARGGLRAAACPEQS